MSKIDAERERWERVSGWPRRILWVVPVVFSLSGAAKVWAAWRVATHFRITLDDLLALQRAPLDATYVGYEVSILSNLRDAAWTLMCSGVLATLLFAWQRSLKHQARVWSYLESLERELGKSPDADPSKPDLPEQAPPADPPQRPPQ